MTVSHVVNLRYWLFAFIVASFLLGNPVRSQAELKEPGLIETLLGVYITTALIEEAGGVDNNSSLNRYLDGIFRQVLSTSVRPGALEWVILDSDAVNAVAAPGGFFAVTRGLLGYIGSDDELACVLGHELGHFELEHGLAQLKRELAFLVGLKVLGIFLGEPETTSEAHRQQAIRHAAEIVSLLFKLKFSRDAEREADGLGVIHTLVAGYNPYGCLNFFERMQDEHGNPHSLEVFLSTHPAFSDRLNIIRAAIHNLGYQIDPEQLTLTRPRMATLPRRGIKPASATLRPSLTESKQAELDEAEKAMNAFADKVEELDQEQAIALFWETTEEKPAVP